MTKRQKYFKQIYRSLKSLKAESVPLKIDHLLDPNAFNPHMSMAYFYLLALLDTCGYEFMWAEGNPVNKAFRFLSSLHLITVKSCPRVVNPVMTSQYMHTRKCKLTNLGHYYVRPFKFKSIINSFVTPAELRLTRLAYSEPMSHDMLLLCCIEPNTDLTLALIKRYEKLWHKSGCLQRKRLVTLLVDHHVKLNTCSLHALKYNLFGCVSKMDEIDPFLAPSGDDQYYIDDDFFKANQKADARNAKRSML